MAPLTLSILLHAEAIVFIQFNFTLVRSLLYLLDLSAKPPGSKTHFDHVHRGLYE